MKAPMYLIKELRLALGLSQKEAAQQIGVNVNTIQHAETGKSLAPRTWRKIVEWYGLEKTPEWEEILRDALSDVKGRKSGQNVKNGQN